MTTLASTVMADARQRTNTVNNTDVSDAVLLGWTDTAFRRLYDMICEKGLFGVSYAEFIVTEASTVTPKGDIGITLPSDFYRIQGLDMSQGGASGPNWITVPRMPESQRNTNWLPSMGATPLSNGGVVNLTGYLPNSLVPGGTLLLLPQNNAAGTYWLRYFPQPTVLATLSTPIMPVFDQSGWWEWASLDVCEIILARHNRTDDLVAFGARKEEARSRIERAAATMDINQGQKLDANRGRQRSGFPWSTATSF